MGYTITSHLAFLQNDSISTQFDVDNTRDIKIQLMKIISAIIERSSFTQEQAAEILHTDQPKVSCIKHLKPEGFAFERIFLFLLRLNCAIELAVTLEKDRNIIKIQPNMKDTRIEIMYVIINIIAKCDLSQVKAAEIMLTNQATISNISRLKTDNLTIEYLMTLIARMECNIEIIVKEKLKMTPKA